MYADGLVVFSPSSAGLQQLLNLCSDFGLEHDILYNLNKRVVMIAEIRRIKVYIFQSLSCLRRVSLCVQK